MLGTPLRKNPQFGFDLAEYCSLDMVADNRKEMKTHWKTSQCYLQMMNMLKWKTLYFRDVSKEDIRWKHIRDEREVGSEEFHTDLLDGDFPGKLFPSRNLYSKSMFRERYCR
jgi:hypothetical protein